MKWTTRKLNYNVLLAVKNIKDRNSNIELLRLKRNGEKSPPGFEIEFEKPNGANTEFTIKRPEGFIVLAIKRVVGGKKNGYREVVYTPYSKELDLPEIRQEGQNYLRTMISRAADNLRQRGVRSRSFGMLVADVVPSSVAFTLSINEHIDPGRFRAGVPDVKLINEVLVVIGANKENAFRYAVSKAGARGLFQFIPTTYALVRIKYPKVDLERDFIKGMDDHLNAAKGSLLLFDLDMSRLPKEDREYLRNNPETMGRYLAATYNGGPGHATSALKRHGRGWEKYVKPETIVYLQKFTALWKIFNG